MLFENGFFKQNVLRYEALGQDCKSRTKEQLTNERAHGGWHRRSWNSIQINENIHTKHLKKNQLLRKRNYEFCSCSNVFTWRMCIQRTVKRATSRVKKAKRFKEVIVLLFDKFIILVIVATIFCVSCFFNVSTGWILFIMVLIVSDSLLLNSFCLNQSFSFSSSLLSLYVCVCLICKHIAKNVSHFLKDLFFLIAVGRFIFASNSISFFVCYMAESVSDVQILQHVFHWAVRSFSPEFSISSHSSAQAVIVFVRRHRSVLVLCSSKMLVLILIAI